MFEFFPHFVWPKLYLHAFICCYNQHFYLIITAGKIRVVTLITPWDVCLRSTVQQANKLLSDHWNVVVPGFVFMNSGRIYRVHLYKYNHQKNIKAHDWMTEKSFIARDSVPFYCVAFVCWWCFGGRVSMQQLLHPIFSPTGDSKVILS